jgi:hypothetical protein
MATAKGTKIEFYRGDSFTATYTVMNGDSPVDISSWEIIFTLKKLATDLDANALISKHASLSTNGKDGAYILTLDKEDTIVDVGSGYIYDIQHTWGGTQRMSIVGSCNVKQDVRLGA